MLSLLLKYMATLPKILFIHRTKIFNYVIYGIGLFDIPFYSSIHFVESKRYLIKYI